MARTPLLGALIGAAAFGLPISPVAAQPADLPVPVASKDALPAGIKVAKIRNGEVYVDARGRVLYGMDMRTLLYEAPDPAQHCADACAQVWEPVLAPAGSRPNIVYPAGNHDLVATRSQTAAGKENPANGSEPAQSTFYNQPQKAPDWTIIAGPQGPQWVYKGWHLVFTRRGDRPGSTAFDGAENFTWNTLKFVPPVPDVIAPQGIKPIFVDGAYQLVDEAGNALFSGKCAKDCARWVPLSAGMAAAPMGDWRVANAGDTPQWSYRGKPVFVSHEDDPKQIPAGGAPLRP
jgi:predicted lipoprotein with Yx(FWY)xxD motif